jgi:hypothetical protein
MSRVESVKRRRGRASVAKCFAPMWTEWSAALQSADWQHKLSKCSTESFELPLPVLREGAMHSNEAGERINSYRNSGFVFFAELHAEADMHDARLNTDSRRACTLNMSCVASCLLPPRHIASCSTVLLRSYYS